jgi:Fe-S-cluster formation regulator IscX/YfhJ
MSNTGNIYKNESTWKLVQSTPTLSPRMVKFDKMHFWAGILTDHKHKPKKKLDAMNQMIGAQDADTRDIFRAALTQVLRQEAIKQLGIFFSWGEIEWTWWLHYKRRPEDTEILTVYEWYAQNKTINRLDANLLLQAVKEMAA